ncbi:hypothetical protein TURU_129886 [Turdus rufiventris]|nr:hypothetical protein TURU_129886 [Turdus rufiventris]
MVLELLSMVTSSAASPEGCWWQLGSYRHTDTQRGQPFVNIVWGSPGHRQRQVHVGIGELKALDSVIPGTARLARSASGDSEVLGIVTCGDANLVVQESLDHGQE